MHVWQTTLRDVDESWRLHQWPHFSGEEIAVWGWAKSSLQQILQAGEGRLLTVNVHVLSGRLKPTSKIWTSSIPCDTVSSKNTLAEDQWSQEETWKIIQRRHLIEGKWTEKLNCNCLNWHSFLAEMMCALLPLTYNPEDPFPPTWQTHCIMRWVFWGPHFSWASLQVENLIFPGDGNLFYSEISARLLCICARVNVLCGRACLSLCLLCILEPNCAMYIKNPILPNRGKKWVFVIHRSKDICSFRG